ncbi:G-protein-signaling modulator 2 [Homalodisca vitripennis]|nr:G-protein-signaling modulator 2 [Homalodisca vitripennis]
MERTLVLAQELGDRAVEAQAYYSLGNTYTLLRDYPTAIDYHIRHLIIAQQLMDRVGEGVTQIAVGVRDGAIQYSLYCLCCPYLPEYNLVENRRNTFT